MRKQCVPGAPPFFACAGNEATYSRKQPINYNNPIYRMTYHNITTHFLNRTTPQIQLPHEILLPNPDLIISSNCAVGHVTCACFDWVWVRQHTGVELLMVFQDQEEWRSRVNTNMYSAAAAFCDVSKMHRSHGNYPEQRLKLILFVVCVRICVHVRQQLCYAK